MSTDLGVAKDIWGRNLNKISSPLSTNPAQNLLNAMMEVPGRKSIFIGKMMRMLKNRRLPTKRQLEVINSWLEEKGKKKVPCPVFIRGRNKKKEMLASNKKEAVKDIAKIQANRPLKPPGK